MTDSDFLAIWKKMKMKRCRVLALWARFLVGQHVRISKETLKFAKGAEQNFSTEIFRVAKEIERRLQPVYELEEFNRTPINGKFYQEEMTPVGVTRSKI